MSVACSVSPLGNENATTGPGFTTVDDDSSAPESADTGGSFESPPSGWGSGDLSCSLDEDCNEYERCTEGICQIDRCSAGDYVSIPPMGEHFVFYADREFAIVDGSESGGRHWIDQYAPDGSVASYESSQESGIEEIVDIAAGDLFGMSVENYAVVTPNGSMGMVQLLGGEGVEDYTVNLSPIALDAGDLDGDGVADVVVISENQTAICKRDGDCEYWSADANTELIDVAIADIDGDGFPEITLLARDDDDWLLIGRNLDSEFTGQPAEYRTELDIADLERIAAGDLDEDGQAEVVILDDKGGFSMRDDRFYIYSMEVDVDGHSFVQQLSESSDYKRLVDLDVADMDADGVAELVALDAHNKVMRWRYDASGLLLEEEWSTDNTEDPKFIALADHDGNSPKAVLKSGPEPVAGAQVPVVLLLLPPFSEEFSSGYSYTGYGLGETYSETYTDTVSLALSADVGVNAEFLSLFKASYSEKVGWKVGQTLGTSSNMATGGRSTMRSNPDVFGYHYGAVVVSWGCFHAYTYEVEDPDHLFETSDGEPIVLTMPVDGGTAMLSTPRYNAMAARIGDMPIFDIPYEVGNPRAYPTEAETVSGDTIEDEAYVFPAEDWYEVSDVGFVGWFNTRGETETTTTTTGIDMGASAKVTVAGVSVGVGFTQSWGSGYSLSLGESAVFFGGIPPFLDDPETPEDEYVDNFYRVKPVFYMDEYTDEEDRTSSYYVATYVVDF